MGFLKNMKSLSPSRNNNNKRRSRAVAMMDDKTRHSDTSIDEDGESINTEPCWFDQAFFRDELLHVRTHAEITKVTFKDFIQRYERDDMLALTDIIKSDRRRRWKVIKFADRIEGANYRRWQFKKENLRRALEQTLKDTGLWHKVPIVFEETLDIDTDDMSGSAIASLLQEVAKDHHVTTLELNGFVQQEDIPDAVNALGRLLKRDDRKWKSIVWRCSFDGEDYPEWDRKMRVARLRLEELATLRRGIPMTVQVC